MVNRVKKSQQRRADILQTARHLFETQGYEKTSMQQLMEQLDIAKGTIYHYFQSKEELLEAVIAEIVEANIKQMEALVEEKEEAALEKLKALVSMGHLASENASMLEPLHQPGNEAMHLRLLAATLMKQAPLYGKLIQQGCDEGIFQTDFPLECAEFILSATQFLTDAGIYPWTRRRFEASHPSPSPLGRAAA